MNPDAHNTPPGVTTGIALRRSGVFPHAGPGGPALEFNYQHED